MMSQHLTSMFEQLGNFTKNNLTHNSKLVKEKENKANANHVGVGGTGGGPNQQASPSHKHGQPPPPLKKPCKLRNVASKAESYDTLYGNSILPFGVETLGSWGPSARSFYKELAKRAIDTSRDQKAGLYLAQRISIAIQRGNAASILGTLPFDSDAEEFFDA